MTSGEEASSATAFALRGASKAFGGFDALRDVTLTIRAGERVAILGPSGAGKSTLLRLMTTAAMPTGGSVEVLGVPPQRLGFDELRALRSRIGMVHQQLLLVPQSSVFQNVLTGRLGRLSLLRASLALLSPRVAREVARVLEQVGLVSKIYERVDRLSGGEQQRVAIARVLYQEPEVLIADEPLSSVDPVRSLDLVRLLSQFARGRTLIVATHQLEPLLPYVSRVVGLREGRLLFDRHKDALTAEDLDRLYAGAGEVPAA
jgi:phosphonate transport system ATP-binding protein